ncbi:MAG: glycosyltransferase family 2 protein [Patescibacteria group bacterium]|nr:glycosyltransferase family 2 protein [Patescibacteria group bacterium]
MSEISIVIPCYNEEATVANVLDGLARVAEKCTSHTFEIIAIDDKSEDGTLKTLESRSDIKIIRNPYNLGYGASLKRGIKTAAGKWIFIIDADGTYPVEKLSDFFPFMDSYDMIVGARVTKVNHTEFIRRVPKKFVNWFAGWLVNRKIPDLNSGMRLFKKDICFEFWGLYPSRYSFTSTITMAFLKNDYLVKFLPIDYHKRVGESGIRPWNFFTYINLIFKIAFYFQPLKFLIPFGIAFFTVGFAKGIYDLVGDNFVGNFSIFLMLSAVLIFFISLIADLLFKQRK